MGMKYLRGWWIVPFLLMSGLTAAGADLRLVDAVQNRDTAAARALVQEGIAVNATQADGTTALHWAARWDQVDVVDLLLQAGANVNAANRYRITPLSLACTNGNAAIVAKLLGAGAKPNAATPDGETPLMTAARTGNAKVVTLLLASGADPNATETWRGQTALMWAAAEKNAAAAQVLIEGGADVGARSTGGMTPLLFAARTGDVDTVETLLAGGANVNETAEDGIRPRAPRQAPDQGDANTTDAPPPVPPGSSVLATAIANAQYDLAAWLVAQGADPNLDGPRGTALHVLVRNRNCEFTALPCPAQTSTLSSFGLAELLLAHGAEVNARLTQNPPKRGSYDYNYMSMVGATPLFLATKASDTALMRLLLAHGADPAIGNEDNTTPLLVAAGIGYIEGQIDASEAQAFEAVDMLVTLGEDVNTTNDSDETALHGAAYRGANRIALYLIDHGAKLDIEDKQGRMPVTIADGAVAGPYFRAHDETAALLRELMGPTAPPRPTTQGSR